MRPLGIRTALNCKIKHFPLQGKWHLLSTYFPSGDWYLFIKWPWAIFLYTLLFNHKMLTTAQLVFLSSSLTCSLLWFIFTVDWLQKACRRAYKDREGGTFRLVVCILVLLVSSLISIQFTDITLLKKPEFTVCWFMVLSLFLRTKHKLTIKNRDTQEFLNSQTFHAFSSQTHKGSL